MGEAANFPIHLVQKNKVGALPYATRMARMGWALRNATKQAHLLINIPKGATNIPIIPIMIMTANPR